MTFQQTHRPLISFKNICFLFRKNLPSSQPCYEPFPSCHPVCAEQSDSCMDCPSAMPKYLGDPGRDAPTGKYMPVHCSSKRPYVHLPGRDTIAHWRISSFDTPMPNQAPESHSIRPRQNHWRQAVMIKSHIEEWPPSLPKAAQEPQKLELLDSFPATFCIHFTFRPLSSTKAFHNILQYQEEFTTKSGAIF